MRLEGFKTRHILRKFYFIFVLKVIKKTHIRLQVVAFKCFILIKTQDFKRGYFNLLEKYFYDNS